MQCLLSNCETFSAANWTWPDDLVEKWLIYPNPSTSECGSSATIFRNMSKDNYHLIQLSYGYLRDVWIDESNLEDADMKNFNIWKLRISNSVFTKLRLPSYLKAIHLQNVPIKVIPQYDSSDFEVLVMWSGKNISINSLDLEGFNKGFLKTLKITHGNLSWFQVGSPFYSLEVLDLHENKLQILPNDLNNLVAVEILNLSKNRPDILEMDLFSVLKHLNTLDLSYNRLSVRTYFPIILPALERLTMNDCALVSLNLLYWQMPNLEILNLKNYNNLGYLEHLRNHFSEDTIIQITNIESWCCDWLKSAINHFKIEYQPSGQGIKQRSYMNGGCRNCLNPFYEPYPVRSVEDQFRIKIYKRQCYCY